jgi:hypothetical protein
MRFGKDNHHKPPQTTNHNHPLLKVPSHTPWIPSHRHPKERRPTADCTLQFVRCPMYIHTWFLVSDAGPDNHDDDDDDGHDDYGDYGDYGDYDDHDNHEMTIIIPSGGSKGDGHGYDVGSHGGGTIGARGVSSCRRRRSLIPHPIKIVLIQYGVYTGQSVPSRRQR